MVTTNNNRTDKILVVDDDARIRDLLRRYLTQEGFEVLLAEDARVVVDDDDAVGALGVGGVHQGLRICNSGDSAQVGPAFHPV